MTTTQDKSVCCGRCRCSGETYSCEYGCYTDGCHNHTCPCHKSVCGVQTGTTKPNEFGDRFPVYCQNPRPCPLHDKPKCCVPDGCGYHQADCPNRHSPQPQQEEASWEENARDMVREVNKMLADAGAVGVVGEENFLYKLRSIIAQAEKRGVRRGEVEALKWVEARRGKMERDHDGFVDELLERLKAKTDNLTQ